MMARDAPEIAPITVIESEPTPAQVSGIALTAGAVSAPDSRSKLAPTGTGTTKPTKDRLPKRKTTARPPTIAGYTWRKDGAGFQLRKTVYESDGTGTPKRKRPYVAHLSKSAFQEMKRGNKGPALAQAIAQWIEDHDR